MYGDDSGPVVAHGVADLADVRARRNAALDGVRVSEGTEVALSRLDEQPPRLALRHVEVDLLFGADRLAVLRPAAPAAATVSRPRPRRRRRSIRPGEVVTWPSRMDSSLSGQFGSKGGQPGSIARRTSSESRRTRRWTRTLLHRAPADEEPLGDLRLGRVHADGDAVRRAACTATSPPAPRAEVDHAVHEVRLPRRPLPGVQHERVRPVRGNRMDRRRDALLERAPVSPRLVGADRLRVSGRSVVRDEQVAPLGLRLRCSATAPPGFRSTQRTRNGWISVCSPAAVVWSQSQTHEPTRAMRSPRSGHAQVGKAQRLALDMQPRGLGALALEVARPQEILVLRIWLHVEGEVVGRVREGIVRSRRRGRVLGLVLRVDHPGDHLILRDPPPT